jgi:prevent-host-death family protein
MDKVIQDHEPMVITRGRVGSVVMLSLEDYNSMQETVYLLKDPANAAKLREAVASVDAGNVTEIALDDLVTL